ncbi:hypothetical protein V8J88_02335 [Massilia sp. W12]|uniref:hypothetical protein n=1 Tax=Massilia sp. W12 TaxID=3126507 RepID=UPI0030D1E3B5
MQNQAKPAQFWQRRALLGSTLAFAAAWLCKPYASASLCAMRPEHKLLHTQVLRNYLSMLLQDARAFHDKASSFRLLLIAGDVSTEQLADRIRQSALLDWFASASIELRDMADIAALSEQQLSQNWVIVAWKPLAQAVQITPSASLQQLDQAQQASPASSLSTLERLQGFDYARFSLLSYSHLHLACSDQLPAQQCLNKAGFIKPNLQAVRSSRPRQMAVNACGEIMRREVNGEIFYLF